MAEKILQTRILNKIDTLANWQNSTLKIKQGEICLATVAASAGTGLTEPVVMAKIGTAEEKTFAELPWSFYAKASDVIEAAKSEAGLTAFVNNVINGAALTSNEAFAALVERVETAEGEIDTLQSEMDAVEKKAADNEAAIGVLNGDASTAGSVAKAIADALAAYSTTEQMNTAINTAKEAAIKHADDLDKAMDERVDVLEAAIAADGAVDTKIKNAIDALDVTDTAVAGKYVSAVNEVDGKVVITRADLPDYTETYAAKVHGHEIADVNGLADAIVDAKKAGTDAATALETYKGTNDEAVQKNADDIAAIKDGATVDSFADVEAELAKKVDKVEGKSLIADTEIARLAAMSDGANKVEASTTNGNIKIDGVETVVYTHPTHAIADITGLQDALDGKQAAGDYAAEVHTHVKADITDFAHTHVASEITDLDATIKGYDYATKTELGDVDAKFANYKTAEDQKAIDDEQDRRLGVIEGDYLKAADKTELEGKITTAQDAADAAQEHSEGVAADLAEAVEALEGADAAQVERIAALEGTIVGLSGAMHFEGVKDEVPTDVTGYEQGDVIIVGNKEYVLNGDAFVEFGDASVNAEAITALTGRVDTLETDMAQAKTDIDAVEAAVATKAEQADLNTLAGRVTTVENDLNTETTGLKARMTQAEADIDALEAKVGEETVEAQIAAAIEALKIGDYAKAADLAAAIERIAQNETDIEALEGRMDTAEGAIDAVEEEVAKKANDADLAAIAKTGNVNDLVQTDGDVIIFDCGSSAV